MRTFKEVRSKFINVNAYENHLKCRLIAKEYDLVSLVLLFYVLKAILLYYLLKIF